jgi:hypothetical protein
MADDEGFYITLPSTASMGVFPENNPSNWITLMTPPIELDSTPWEVGLSEIHMPNKWMNITEGNNSFEITFGDIQQVVLRETISTEPVLRVSNQTAVQNPASTHGITFSYETLSGPYIAETYAIPYNQAIHITLELDKDKYYTRDDYLSLIRSGFEQLKDIEIQGITFKDGAEIHYRSFYRDGQPSYMYEIIFKDGWRLLYDCFTIDNLHIPLSRFWGIVPSELVKPFEERMRVHKFDNLNTFDATNKLMVMQRALLSMKMKTVTCRLQPGCYTTPERLVDAMMDAIPRQCKDYFRLSLTESRTLRISSYNYHHFNITFSSDTTSLGPMLGLHESDLGLALPRQPVDLESTGLYVGTYPIDINRGVFGFYVYCDLVMPEYVGDTKANLLRVIPANSETLIVHDYSRGAHYKPLSVKQIAKIHIVIKTDSNEELKFTNSKTLCKLHFRKKR